MRRLYLQIYAVFLAIIVVFALLAALLWRFGPSDADPAERLAGAGALLSRWLPPAERPAQEQQAALDQLARWFDIDASLRARDGSVIAAVGRRAHPPPPRGELDRAAPPGESRSAGPAGRGRHRGPALRLDDGRTLIVHWGRPRWPKRLLGGLALLALAVAIGAYPIARRITRRVETLQHQVDALGKGELTARVDVRGNDEIAQLARSFNHAAEQIEKLINAQRSTLAAASHELRSPLARIRMGIELLGSDARADVRERLSKDIAELDELVGELLLASRLDAIERLDRVDRIDLLGLLAEEGARVGAEVSGALKQTVGADVSGQSVQIHGDARMLRRLVRNLLENARRYGAGSPIEAWVAGLPQGGATLSVADRGPGVPESERERIFEPFYRLAGSAEQGAGVGLGLALVRQIARHHGGEVRCLAREGGGTCFEVTLGLGRAG